MPLIEARAAVAALGAAGVTAVGVPLLITALGRVGVFDRPNARSSHTTAVPRGAGLAVVPGIAVGLAVLAAVDDAAVVVAVAGLLYGAIGLADDVRSLPARGRLVAQVVLAIVVVVWLASSLGPLVGALAVVWLVAWVNAFNFMDGVNGIAGAQLGLAGLAWWVVGDLEDVGLLRGSGVVLVAAAVAFLPFNVPRARVFLGDSGSYGVGAVLGALVVLGVREGIAVEALVAPLVVFGADTLLTLLRRAAHRRPLLEAHREHTYQQLVDLGWSHVRVTSTVSAFIVVCAVAGLWATADGLTVRVVADLVVACVAGAYLLLPTALRSRRC